VFFQNGSTATIRSGAAYGGGVRSTLLTSEKMAAFAPMPSANVTTTARLTTGVRRIVRSP